MNTQLSLFQIVLLAVFGVGAVLGMLFLAGVFGGSSAGSLSGPVRIWGTLDGRGVDTVIRQLAESNESMRQVSYVQKNPATYASDVANALASGTGPDLFLISQDMIVSNAGKIQMIPFASLAQQEFSTTFIDEAALYVGQEGELAIPIAVDPLVLFWNKDALARAGYAQPPAYWEDVYGMAAKLTERDDSEGITKSAIAFGSFDNVTNAKDILSTLIMQAGGGITQTDAQNRVVSVLSANKTLVVPGNASASAAQPAAQLQPTESALRFYTQFADPSQKTIYSWNRALDASQSVFAAGDLALYIGYASELPVIAARNPNLNIGVAPLPQVKTASKAVSFGKLYALAIPKAAANPTSSFIAAQALASADASKQLALAWGMESARRDVLATPVDGTDEIFRRDAIIAQGWLDPDPAKTDDIFRSMIENVVSGANMLTDSIQRADKQLSALLGF